MAATAPPENVDDAIEQLASLLTSQGIAGDDSEETRRLLESLSAKVRPPPPAARRCRPPCHPRSRAAASRTAQLKELGAGDSSATPATSSPSPSGSGDDTMPAPSDTPSSAPSGGGRNGRGGRRAPVRMSTDDSGGEYMDVVDEDVGEEGEGEEARSGSPGASETRSVSRSSYTGSSGGGGGDDDADSGEGLQYREVRRGAPKPIDLWRVKHAEDPAARRARAASEPLTAERMSELIERLHDGPLVKRAEWMRAQRKKMAEEMKQLTFSPAVNRRSRQLAEGLGTLEDRLNAAVAARKFREAQVRQEHVEAAAAPFQPDTATPCVCGGGRGLVEAAAKGEDAEKVHTCGRGGGGGGMPRVRNPPPFACPLRRQYCLNFMRACEVSGGGRSRGARAWARDSQFLLKYEQLKAIRLEQRKAILKEMEDRDLTFKPQINESSAKVRAARVDARGYGGCLPPPPRPRTLSH